MPQCHGPVVGLALKHVGEMHGAEALASRPHNFENLACFITPVDSLGGVEADVAIAAGLRCLAEIAEQALPAAGRRFAIGDKCFEPLALAALPLLAAIFLFDKAAAHDDI